MKAVWNNQIVAESDDAIQIEGNYYFPPDSVKKEYFKPSDMRTTCHWKGEASYYDVNVNGEVNANAAWFYANPSYPARQIKNYVAFWQGVEVV